VNYCYFFFGQVVSGIEFHQDIPSKKKEFHQDTLLGILDKKKKELLLSYQ
jgi:hypothetical protein